MPSGGRRGRRRLWLKIRSSWELAEAVKILPPAERLTSASVCKSMSNSKRWYSLRPLRVPSPTVTPMIRFNRPSLEGSELDYIADAVSGGHTASLGPYSERCADLLRERVGVEDVLMTTSCTDALEMTSLLLDVGPGDTVIVPSFTFTSTALAYAGPRRQSAVRRH